MFKKLLSIGGAACLCAAFLFAGGCGKAGNAPESGHASVAEQIEKAWLDYRLNEWNSAEAEFTEALARTEPGSDDWAMCLYGLATTWNLRRPGEDPEKAAKMYRELLEKAPDSPMAPWTALALARQLHLVPVGQEPDYKAVNAAYQDIVDRYPGHLAAKEAFVYLQSILLAKLEPEAAKTAAANLEEYVGRETKEFVGPSYSLLSVAYTLLDEQAKRLDAEENAFEKTEVDPSDPSVEFAWAYWNLACISEFELGDFERARRYYKELIRLYPTDIRVYGCKQALRRMDELETKIRAELAAEKEADQ